jgi:hypothetical protein
MTAQPPSIATTIALVLCVAFSASAAPSAAGSLIA